MSREVNYYPSGVESVEKGLSGYIRIAFWSWNKRTIVLHVSEKSAKKLIKELQRVLQNE